MHWPVENPLLREKQKRIREKLLTRFPELINSPNKHYLVLGKYVSGTPERFYCRTVYKNSIVWLEKRNLSDQNALNEYFRSHAAEIDLAFLQLQEINTLDWHDQYKIHSVGDYELIRFIDRHIHPTYLRLVEAVYAPFIRLIAHFSRIDRGKGTDDLKDLLPAVKEVANTTLHELTQPYRHLVRNGIAHGGITYLHKEILYTDKKGNTENYSERDIIRLFDNLLDVCNGFALALSVFFISHQGEYEPPRQFLLDELREETRAPWWEIVGCIPSEIGEKKQLIIHIHVKTSDRSKVLFSTIQSGLLAELYAPGFHRYFFSFNSSVAPVGWAVLDGLKLSMIRNNSNPQLEDYKGIIVDNMFFFIPKINLPRIFQKFSTLFSAITLHWPVVMEELRDKLGIPTIHVRNVNIHRNGCCSILRGSVVVELADKHIDQPQIRKLRREIIRLALQEARRKTSIFSIVRYLPLGFARISVFQNDYRIRQLESYGLGRDLVCTVQVKRIRRIRSPDILGATIEQLGIYRIAWNKAWLQTQNGGL